MSNPLNGKRVFRMGSGWVKRLGDGKIIGPFDSEREAENAYENPKGKKVTKIETPKKPAEDKVFDEGLPKGIEDIPKDKPKKKFMKD